MKNQIRHEIELTEDVYGMYNTRFKKGSRFEYDSETEDAYILIAGHGQETVIPKSKAIKIKITTICREEREIIPK